MRALVFALSRLVDGHLAWRFRVVAAQPFSREILNG